MGDGFTDEYEGGAGDVVGGCFRDALADLPGRGRAVAGDHHVVHERLDDGRGARPETVRT
jgi:hypothetical protein